MARPVSLDDKYSVCYSITYVRCLGRPRPHLCQRDTNQVRLKMKLMVVVVAMLVGLISPAVCKSICEPGFYATAKYEKYGAGKRVLYEIRRNGKLIVYENSWSERGESVGSKYFGTIDVNTGIFAYKAGKRQVKGWFVQNAHAGLSVVIAPLQPAVCERVNLADIMGNVKMSNVSMYYYDVGYETRYPICNVYSMMAASKSHFGFAGKTHVSFYNIATGQCKPIYLPSRITSLVASDDTFWGALDQTLLEINPSEGVPRYHDTRALFKEKGRIEHIEIDPQHRWLWLLYSGKTNRIWKYDLQSKEWGRVSLGREGGGKSSEPSPRYMRADNDALVVYCEDLVVVVEHDGEMSKVENNDFNVRSLPYNTAQVGSVHYSRAGESLLAINTKSAKVERRTIYRPGSILSDLISAFPWVKCEASYYDNDRVDRVLEEAVDNGVVRTGTYYGEFYCANDSLLFRDGRRFPVTTYDAQEEVSVLADLGDKVLLSPDSGLWIYDRESMGIRRIDFHGKVRSLLWYRGEMCALYDDNYEERRWGGDTGYYQGEEYTYEYCVIVPLLSLLKHRPIHDWRVESTVAPYKTLMIEEYDSSNNAFVNENGEFVVRR